MDYLRSSLFCLALLGSPAVPPHSARADDAGGLAFFEKKIRPLLIDKCYECHADQKQKGGLRVDSKEALLIGGDSGPAIHPGNPDESLLATAISYSDPDLKMPPKEKLSETDISALTEWIRIGAPDPRSGEVVSADAGYVNVEAGRQFWSFQPPKKTAPPPVKFKSWPRTDIDRFILARLESEGLKPVRDAGRTALIRRVYYDLTGLPPAPTEIDAFLKDKSPEALARVIDRLLASPHFGERWGRHWLDVARFAESSGGGRTLPFKDAWRFRDYVVEAFNRDVPYDQFIREQIAGDLLPAGSHEERSRQLVATGFLALGPTNYEEQDKAMLRMDIIDEQLDTVGKAFLGMAMGCARCHDHKFDPIPTRDYYAMAGIFLNSHALRNYTDNVAHWVAVPLPLDDAREKVVQEQEANIAEVQARLKRARDAARKANAVIALTSTMPGEPIAIRDLPGIIMDDTKATRIGDWTHSTFSKSYIGEGYLHDGNTDKGAKTLTFIPELPRSGRFEVRLAYISGKNRAARVPVTVFHADGEKTLEIDMTEPPQIDGRFVSLGQYRFEQDGQGYVLISNEDTTGHVVVDALQFISPQLAAQSVDDRKASASKADNEVRDLERQLKELQAAAIPRPLAMSVREAEEIEEARIAIRGNIHNLGDQVPRGFLTVASLEPPPMLPSDQSGRRELAEWLAAAENPLTARVMVNRVWHWLFGAGLVRTTDNFGATGELPSHPELLDHLALRFIEDGWSVKKLIRAIMLSRVYQLSTESDNMAAAADPENRLLWRMNRRRLDAESIRDTILSVSGQIDLSIGGPNIAGAGDVNPNDASAGNLEYGYKFLDTRRSLYTPAFRNHRLELFEAFDAANPNVVTGTRHNSTVALQALYLLNHPFVIEQARFSAQRTLGGDSLDDTSRVKQAYRMTLGRPPTRSELRVALDFLNSAGVSAGTLSREDNWAHLFQSLFASLDFRHLN